MKRNVQSPAQADGASAETETPQLQEIVEGHTE
jgi:hypothetical protein